MIYPHGKLIYINSLLKIINPMANVNQIFRMNGFFILYLPIEYCN